MRHAWSRPHLRGGQLAQFWQRLSLDRQFVIAASFVILMGMGVIGFWVADRIRTGVVYDSAYEATLNMDRYVAPLSQELETSEAISPENIDRLNKLLESWMGRRIYSIKVWRLDGVVAYSNWPDLIGRAFPQTADFRKALQGNIAADFESHAHDADGREQITSTPMIEIYAPVRSERTGDVIAVAEFYAMASTLDAQLWRSTVSSWLLVGVIGALMTGALFGIVWRGRLTIDEQRDRLQRQITRLSDLLAENERLQTSLKQAYTRTASVNERFLRRVGADLHDGPAQLLSLGLLKLHALEPAIRQASQSGAAQGLRELKRIETALKDALGEVRTISSGLSLPDLATETLEGCIRRVVRTHEDQSGTPVALEIARLPRAAPQIVKASVYRFVQETLNNAFRHAGGVDQCVRASADANTVIICVSDSGPGISPSPPRREQPALGLIGLRDRIETLGGRMTVTSTSGAGTRVEMRLDLDGVDHLESQP